MYRLKFVFLLSFTNTVLVTGTPQCEGSCTTEVSRFREFIAIETTRASDFTMAVDFWKLLAKEENVEIQVYEYVENNPVIVLKYPGLDSSLHSIILSAHIDVVPAYYEDGWTYPPFVGMVNDQCEVVGRGTVNMKSNAIQYFEAMNRLKNNNITLLRDVYIVLTPDETAGSLNGGDIFVKTEEFKEMNAGFAFTVGISSPNEELSIFYRDKTVWEIKVDCYGQTSTSGLLLDSKTTAEGPCASFYESYIDYREEQYEKSVSSADSGTYTTINYLGGCIPTNYAVIPGQIHLYYTIALSRDSSVQEFNQTLKQWISRAGGDIRLSTELLVEKAPFTKIDNNNPYWVAINEVFDELNIPINPTTTLLVSDANFIVKAGVPSFGLSPQTNTPSSLFSVNERLSIRTFLDGICIYEQLIERVANLSDEQVDNDPTTYIDYSDV